MGWERGRYYTRSRKINGRVVREYVGGGEAGDLCARLDAIKREQLTAETHAFQSLREDLTERDALLEKLGKQCDELIRAAMVVAGFHCHNRGKWRRKRV